MIRFIKGILRTSLAGSVIIETPSGIGFRVNIPTGSGLYKLSDGSEVEVYTSMVVKEDSMSLYGFTSKDELELFELLITVSGIGAKGAMSIMSTLMPRDLKLAIASGDAKTIAQAQGVGKKTAERLILELKDKVGSEFDFSAGGSAAPAEAVITRGSVRDNAVEALISLGYSRTEASTMVARVPDEGLTAEEYIRRALVSA